MIDLKRPLEGVPGLLLMGALIFFGATIGIAVALVFTWIPMSDSLANFLGGVVGAGLGAALAVMGAVYVQQRERRDQLAAPINSLEELLGVIQFHMQLLGARLLRRGEDYLDVFAQDRSINESGMQLLKLVREIPNFHELPRKLGLQLAEMKFMINQHLNELLDEVEKSKDTQAIRYGRATSELEEAQALVANLLREVEALA